VTGALSVKTQTLTGTMGEQASKSKGKEKSVSTGGEIVQREENERKRSVVEIDCQTTKCFPGHQVISIIRERMQGGPRARRGKAGVDCIVGPGAVALTALGSLPRKK